MSAFLGEVYWSQR